MSTHPHICHVRKDLAEGKISPVSEDTFTVIPYDRTYQYQPHDEDGYINVLYDGQWHQVASIDFDFPHQTEEA
jgi:hypothetical protein